MKGNKKILVTLGYYKIIRFYDIVSIIAFSIFANLFIDFYDELEKKSWFDLLLAISTFLTGISLSIMFSIYNHCHKRTEQDPGKENYLVAFSNVVNNNKGALWSCWIVFVIAIVIFLYLLIMKLNPEAELFGLHPEAKLFGHLPETESSELPNRSLLEK